MRVREEIVILWAAVLAISVMAVLSPHQARAAAEQGKYGINWTTLSNGMDIIAVENHALPLVTIEIVVKNGAFTEPPELDGLSHLYEHMFFKGNAVLPNQERYMERLLELGASWNGTTGGERVNYFMIVHKKNLREGAAFLRDALRYPLFAEEELRRERPVVLSEFNRNEADPSFHLRRELDRKLWSRYFSRKNTIGDREVILGATREQMRMIQHRYYVPNNSALIIGGDIDPGEVFEMAEDLFGDWERSADPHEQWPVPEHPPLESTRRIAVLGEVGPVSVQLAWHGPGMKADTASTFAADVLSFILAQPDSNFQKALVDSGHFDAIGLSYYSQVHTGPISVSASTSADRLDEAWSALEAELDKLDDPEYVTDEQIESAKNILEIGEIYGREELHGQFCHTLAFWWSTGGLEYYLDYIENLRAVTRADLIRYVQTYIKGKDRIEAILINESNLDGVEFVKSAEVIRPASGSSVAALAMASGASEITTEEFVVDGLRVVLRRNPLSEIVVAEMVLIGGLQYYGVENAGRELLLLETLDKGSRNFSKEEVNRRLAMTGASLFSVARHDYSTFGLRTLRRDFERNFSIFADALSHPLLNEEEVDLGVERRLNSIAMQEQVPDAYIPILASRNFYSGHPYEAPPSGTEEAVSGLSADDLRRIHRETFLRERMKLFLIGDLERSDAERLVREGLSELPSGSYERRIVMRESDRPPSLLIEDRDLPTNYIWGTFQAPNFSSPDYAPLRVGLSILSDRLFEEVRTKRNLSYAVSAQASSRLSNYGVLYVTAVSPAETIAVMLDEVDRLIEEPVPEKLLRDKIEEMITRRLMGNQTGASQLEQMILYDVNGPGWQAESRAVEQMRAVTAARIQEVSARYLVDFSFTVLGDSDQIEGEAIFTSSGKR